MKYIRIYIYISYVSQDIYDMILQILFQYLSTLESLCRLVPRDSTSEPSNDCMLDKLLSVPQIAGDCILKVNNNKHLIVFLLFFEDLNPFKITIKYIQRIRDIKIIFV